jgi:hypothetical protein
VDKLLREEPSTLEPSDDTYTSDYYLPRDTRYLQLDRSFQPGKVISAWAVKEVVVEAQGGRVLVPHSHA